MNNMTKYAEYESKRKSYGIAYLLWIVGGWIGVHAAYLNQPVITIMWVVFTYLTVTDPATFINIYFVVCLIGWVRVYFRTKELNGEDLVWLKHSDEDAK